MNNGVAAVLAAFALLFATAAIAQDEEDEGPKPAWSSLNDSQRRDVMSFAGDYMDFMSRAKTELSFVSEAVRIARAEGFRELTPDSNLRPGARF